MDALKFPLDMSDFQKIFYVLVYDGFLDNEIYSYATREEAERVLKEWLRFSPDEYPNLRVVEYHQA